MRGSNWLFTAALVLVLGSATGTAFAVEKEPVSGGLLSSPGNAAPSPVPAAPQEVRAPTTVAAEVPIADDTSWGLLVRGGYFGLPNFIADELFFKHPGISGYNLGAEIRYHGKDGGRGVSSIGLAVDSATANTDGEWQKNETDEIVNANGNISVLAITVTGYWSLFPAWYVHPYIGVGIGIAHVKGYFVDETERIDADIWIPAVHIPVGLAVELSERLQFTAEGRFINGIAVGGALQVRF